MSRPVKNAKKILSYRSAVEGLESAIDGFSYSLATRKLDLEQVRELKQLQKRMEQVFLATFQSNPQTGRFA